MEEKVWITQVPGMVLLEKTNTYERGTYYFFDVQSWRKVSFTEAKFIEFCYQLCCKHLFQVAKEFHLDYSKLEGRPVLNTT